MLKNFVEIQPVGKRNKASLAKKRRLPTYVMEENKEEAKDQAVALQDKAKQDEVAGLSGQTRVGKTPWKMMKHFAMKPDYTESSWYAKLMDEDKEILEDLRDA